VLFFALVGSAWTACLARPAHGLARHHHADHVPSAQAGYSAMLSNRAGLMLPSRCRSATEEGPMTAEYAVFAVGAFLVVAVLIWNMQRVIAKRLAKLQAELSELHFVVSRLSVLMLNAIPKGEAAVPYISSPKPEVASKHKRRSHALEAELDEVHELCAKLITLVPPAEAVPLLAGRDAQRPVNRIEGRKPLRAGSLRRPSVRDD
jgi:hypothetical protein